LSFSIPSSAIIINMPFIPQRRHSPELLDLPGHSHAPHELAGCLADIRKVNRYLGGATSALAHFSEMVEGMGDIIPGRVLSVLDVGAGSADIPIALAEWARERGINIKITAVDINPEVAGFAKRYAKGYPEINFAVADGLKLPFPSGSFDLAFCSMTLHHLNEEDSKAVIRNMAQVAREGYAVCDLRRSYVAYALIYILTRFLTKNRLTRYDGPLSVLRSYTDIELAALAKGAGLEGFRVVKHPFWRMALVGGRACRT
jgi:SAM-dependent methyltransferase